MAHCHLNATIKHLFVRFIEYTVIYLIADVVMKNSILLCLVFLLVACGQDAADDQSKTTTPETVAKQTTKVNDGSPAELVINDQTPFKVLSVSEGIYEQTSALQINLNLPVKQKQDFAQLIRVLNNGQLVKTDWLFSDNKMVMYYPFIEADTQYEINISQSLTSNNGKVLAQATQKKITTQPKKKSARFLSQGNTLLRTDDELPIEAVNVDAVELKFWRVKDTHLHQFLQHPNKRDIYSLKRLTEVAELVHSGHFDLNEIKNKVEHHNIPIADIEAIKTAGTYFVTMMPDDAYDYDYESTWFIQTDLGLHTRVYKTSVAVFAHQLPAANVYPEVKVALIDNKGAVMSEGVTDAHGFVELNISKSNEMRYVLASRGDELNLVRLNQPKLDLSDYKLANRMYHPQELFLYAPRDLYRPGETVNINGLLRDADGQMVTASLIKVEIRRPDNRLFKEISWLGDEQAFYQTEFALPDDAMTGTWYFSAKLANNTQFSYPFSVEDFLPERLKLDLSVGNASEHVPVTESPVINIQSDYLYGAPADGNRYDATVTVNATTHLFDAYKDYFFGSNHDKNFDTNFTTDPAELDHQGFAQLQVPNKWLNTQFPLRISSHVNVYESGGRPISRQIKQTVWPNELAVGIKPMWDGRFASPNKVNSVGLVAVDRQGEAISVEQAEIMLIQENRKRYWHWGDDGWDYRNNNQEIPVFNAVVDIAADQENLVSLPLDYGSYRVEIRTREQKLLSSYRFFSGWRWYDPYASSGEKPDQVKLAWQADDLIPGQEAALQVTAPYAGTALVTVESDDILWHQSIELSQAQDQVLIPIDSSWRRHDLYASVMVIKAGAAERAHLPKRALGVIHLPLNRTARKLNVELVHPEKTMPEEPLTVVVKALNIEDQQETYVTLAAVDTGVLNVSNFKTPKPFEWFFAKRQYWPALRDVYGSLIEMIDAQRARQKFGGDADIARGGDEAKADVQIVSLFTEKVKFNQTGEAAITLPLPYFNGELRLMAVAFNEHQFAGADSRIKVAAPVVVTTSTPRFMAKGDQSTATIEVHNTEATPTELNIQVTADAALGGQSQAYEWSMAADEKKIIQLPLTGNTHQGLANIQVRADSSTGFKLDRVWKLGLRPAMPAVIDQYKAVLKPAGNYLVDSSAYNKFDLMNLKAVMQVSDTPLLNREDQLHQLLQYPYGCLEQTSSRAWSLLYAEAADYALYNNSQQSQLYEQRFVVVNKAISRLLGMQIYSGGFGLWSEDSPEENWLTVYVTDFLVEAKKLGYQVPEAALNKAITRLQNYVRNAGQINSNLAQYLSHRNHFEISYKAYAAYVLAGMKLVSLQDLRRLYDEFNEQARSPLPLAHLAMGLELLGDERRANEAWLKAIDFKWDRDRYSYYGDYGSKIRDYAAVVALGAKSQLIKQLPKSTLDLIMPLQEDLSSRRWLSTQERGTLFKTAKLLKQASPAGSQWSVTVDQADNETVYQQTTDLLQVWRETAAQTGLTVSNTGEKPVYLDVKYQGYLKQHLAENNGMVVRKKYFDINGNKVDLKQIDSGDFVLVHLEISLDEKYDYLPDAMVIDLLPAGLELENQNLEHALKLDDIKVDGKYVRDWGGHTRIKHSEFRDDRFVAALTLSSYQNAHVFYLARAVTPGDYVIPPALVEDMYRPEIRATSDDLGHLIIK